jgi:hypothetical protein
MINGFMLCAILKGRLISAASEWLCCMPLVVLMLLLSLSIWEEAVF